VYDTSRAPRINGLVVTPGARLLVACPVSHCLLLAPSRGCAKLSHEHATCHMSRCACGICCACDIIACDVWSSDVCFQRLMPHLLPAAHCSHALQLVVGHGNGCRPPPFLCLAC
jgi:hypothetical protein